MTDENTAPTEPVRKQRNPRMSIPVIDPVSDYRNQQELRRAEALTEEGTITMQLEALEKQLLAQRRIIAACDAAIAATTDNESN